MAQVESKEPIPYSASCLPKKPSQCYPETHITFEGYTVIIVGAIESISVTKDLKPEETVIEAPIEALK